jgi:hypothetical protein
VPGSGQSSLLTDAGKMSQGQKYSGNMPDDMEGGDLLALFVLDDIPNEVRMTLITNRRIQC